jgi:hypothetical protein
VLPYEDRDTWRWTTAQDIVGHVAEGSGDGGGNFERGEMVAGNAVSKEEGTTGV